jgi:hypothetical protein
VCWVCGSQRGCNLNSDEYLRSICSYATCRIVAGRNPPAILFESDMCVGGTNLGCRFGWPLQSPAAPCSSRRSKNYRLELVVNNRNVTALVYLAQHMSSASGRGIAVPNATDLFGFLGATITIERRECSSDGCLVQLVLISTHVSHG